MPTLPEIISTPLGPNVMLPCGCLVVDRGGSRLEVLGCTNNPCRVRARIRLLAFDASIGKWRAGEA